MRSLVYTLVTFILSASFLLSEDTLAVEAVIFDCDGVLVDTEYLKFMAWQEALSECNIPFSIEEYEPLVGHSSEEILRRIVQIKNCPIPIEVIDVKNKKYKVLQSQGVAPISSLVEFAAELSRNKHLLGIQLGLASSAPKEEILINLKQVGLDQAFDLVISGSDDLDAYTDETGKNKPKPYIYLEAAKRLDVSPANCLVFEDTEAGVVAASSAGMTTIAVPNRFTASQDFSKASKQITYEELPLLGLSP